MSAIERKDYGFDRLYQAVLYQPHTVAQMLREESALLKCQNYSGETVLEWFAVENNLEIITLLKDCGAEYSDYALAEACCSGHVEMVYLLLGMGVVPDIAWCWDAIRRADVPRKTFVKIKRAFHRHGYKFIEVV